jgi:hypothetical protein
MRKSVHIRFVGVSFTWRHLSLDWIERVNFSLSVSLSYLKLEYFGCSGSMNIKEDEAHSSILFLYPTLTFRDLLNIPIIYSNNFPNLSSDMLPISG